jgi:hypothetical protein
MSAIYKFCVTRKSDSKLEKFGAEYRFAIVDAGKEAARILIASKLQQADTTNVHVEDYNVNNCGPIRDENTFTITMTAEQVQQFGAAIAAGNWVGAAAIAVEVGAGISEETLTKVGKWLGVGGGGAGMLPEPTKPFKRPF